MSKTQKYVLKPGFTHYDRGEDGQVRQVPAGSVCDLTEAQAENFADRFELLSAVQARAEAEAAMAAAATAEAEAQDAAADDAGDAGTEAETEAAPAFDASAHSADELKQFIADAGSVAEVEAIADSEQAGKARVSVLRAADDRIEELTGTEE